MPRRLQKTYMFKPIALLILKKEPPGFAFCHTPDNELALQLLYFRLV